MQIIQPIDACNGMAARAVGTVVICHQLGSQAHRRIEVAAPELAAQIPLNHHIGHRRHTNVATDQRCVRAPGCRRPPHCFLPTRLSWKTSKPGWMVRKLEGQSHHGPPCLGQRRAARSDCRVRICQGCLGGRQRSWPYDRETCLRKSEHEIPGAPRVGHRIGRSSQAPTAAVDQSASLANRTVST